jgi:hypothetical protein
MKNKVTVVLSAAAALAVVLAITGPVGAGSLAKPHLQGGAPTVVSYQGQVTVGGSPYDDTGYFKFAVVNAAGTTTYWSNDGTSSGEPSNAVPLTVAEGLFNVLLGDTALTNMTQPLSASVFDGTNRYLRVWFSTDGSTFQRLSPDRRIAAVPYALQAQEAADADRLDGQQGTYYQARVGGACPVGSTVRAVNADGTVVCQADAPLNRIIVPTANVSTTLDSAGDVGQYTSLTIGADGLGLISYWDGFPNRDLKVAHCSDPACTSATVTTLDNIGDVGQYTSLTIGADGLGLISYYDATNGHLKVAHCSDLACTSAVTSTLDSSWDVGYDTSVTIGADGLGLISYLDDINSVLKVAHCSNLACTSATVNTLDSNGSVGAYTSVTIGADGLGLISYWDGTNTALKVAHCDDLACTSAISTTLDSTGNVGVDTSVTIGADGLGLISYRDQDNTALKVAHCNDLACTSAVTTTLDSAGNVGWHTSVTVGADGLGLISYFDDTTDDLKVAHCGGLACTSAITSTLDSAGTVGDFTSVTIGADGLPLISYYDYNNSALKVAHCGSPFCVGYFRRR